MNTTVLPTLIQTILTFVILGIVGVTVYQSRRQYRIIVRQAELIEKLATLQRLSNLTEAEKNAIPLSQHFGPAIFEAGTRLGRSPAQIHAALIAAYTEVAGLDPKRWQSPGRPHARGMFLRNYGTEDGTAEAEWFYAQIDELGLDTVTRSPAEIAWEVLGQRVPLNIYARNEDLAADMLSAAAKIVSP